MKWLTKPALATCGALVASVVGAGVLAYAAQGGSSPAFHVPAPSFARTVADGRPDAVLPDAGSFGAPTSPVVELSSLPPLPERRPRGENYVVISRQWNRLWLLRDAEILHSALCATGKGDTLVWEKGSRTWVFNTPTGEFRVQHKSSNPRWVPPEWEYVERGEEPPDWLGRNRAASYDMLGDYAINFGDDYNIHGTLYEGLLGRSITHGCVRVGAVDLAYVYPRVQKGTKVFIY